MNELGTFLLIGTLALVLVAVLGCCFYWFRLTNTQRAKAKLAELIVIDEVELDNYQHFRSGATSVNMRNKTNGTFLAVLRHSIGEDGRLWLPTELKDEWFAEQQGFKMELNRAIVVGTEKVMLAGTDIPMYAIKIWEQGQTAIAGKQFHYCKALEKSPRDGTPSAAFWARSLDYEEHKRIDLKVYVIGSADRELLDREVERSLKLIKSFL